MFKLKRMTALLMSVLLMGSTVCAPAMAAEVTGEEQGAVQEEVAKQEVALETEGEAAGQEVPPEEEPENAAENVTAEAAAPIEQGGEPEEAEEFDTSETAEEFDTSETAEEEQPEAGVIESQESSDESTVENAAGTGSVEQEDEYLPIVIADGVTEDTDNNDAYDASAEWSAEELSSLPVLDTDVSSASDGCVLLGMPGEFIADQQAFLDRINEIRREACEEGVINPSTGMPLTPEDYRPLKWSYDLEKVARIRAAESSMTGYHVRANGASWQSVECEPFYLGECIAWNYNKSATAGIRQWYGEKQYWVEGRTDKETGHYTNMILPEARYVGGATFWSPYAEYPNTTLLEYSFEEGLDESFVDMTGECIQMLEISESNLSGKPSIIGSASGVKGDENTLLLTENALYDGPVFSSDTGHLLFIDGVSWSSSDSGIASVSADGIVEARKCGSATITAQAENGSSADAEFTVEHVLQKMPAVDATCTKSGLTEGEKCSNCGKVTIAQETVPAKGHAYSGWKVTKEATCTAKGSKEKICTNCGDKVTEAIPANGHKWNSNYTVDKAATCTEDGSESKHCSVCNAIDQSTVRAIQKKGHAYGSWKVTKEATCTAKGSKEKICTNCGNKVTEAIPAAGHKWNENYTVDIKPTIYAEGSESKHCSVCGEIDSDSVRTIPKLKGIWKKNSKGWWYDYGDGSYPVSKFESINGSVYYFNGSGYMVTGWQKIDGSWYYFGAGGAMQTGWQKIGGKWYYMNESGVMQTGWKKISGRWYYFEGSGAMAANKWVGNYYLKGNGSMATNTWIGKYYVGPDGKWIPGYKAAN